MATVDPFEYSRVWTDPADFPSISYTKSWESQDDFPTIETDFLPDGSFFLFVISIQTH